MAASLSLQHAKLLHSIQVGGGQDGVAQDIYDSCLKACKLYGINVCSSLGDISGKVTYLKIFGFLLEPWDFVNKALQHPHPFCVESCLPEELQAAIFANVTGSCCHSRAEVRIHQAVGLTVQLLWLTTKPV